MRDPLSQAKPLWRRLVLGAVLIVAASAAATAAAALNELHGFVHALAQTPAPNLGHELTPAAAGAPQTILLMGSDKRAQGAIDASSPPHTDTLMLARVDPSQNAITLMSIPRDLKVTIDLPGRGPTTEKINAAYSIGGPKLALATVERVLGVRVNHLVDTNFGGFRQAVDYLGCVYVDVDHRYYNDNSGPDQYATINVPAGYQRLCGHDALDYVRYRHLDSDFVRVARQQDFVRQLKDQLGGSRLLRERLQLAAILGRETETDIHSTTAVARLLEVLLLSVGHPIRQIHFPGTAGPSYVTAPPDQMHDAARQFLAATKPPQQTAPSRALGRPHGQSSAPPDFEDAPTLGQSAAQALGDAGMPVYYPTKLRTGGQYDTGSRAYTLRDDHGVPRHAYRIVVATGAPGDYYGIQGTDWTDPPILRHPSETRTIAGRRLELFYAGSRLRLVAFRSGRDVYWASNTLLQTLDYGQMITLATSLARL